MTHIRSVAVLMKQVALSAQKIDLVDIKYETFVAV